LNAALVTLSGCQTARGKVITGEGMVGLTRAFFHAGAHAVMASLWNVDDASTAELMKRFYGALRSGQAIDEAARSAKLSFLAAGGRLRHPYFWGAFVVSGNARAVVSVAGTGSTVSAVALAAIAACILLLVLWGRRRGALRHRAA
jgi:CHAT domain-containing protein